MADVLPELPLPDPTSKPGAGGGGTPEDAGQETEGGEGSFGERTDEMVEATGVPDVGGAGELTDEVSGEHEDVYEEDGEADEDEEEEEYLEVEGFEFIGAEQEVIAAPTRRRRSVDAEEIERVEREMRGRRRRRLLIIGGAVLALLSVLCVGGFVLFAMARVNNARAQFDSTMDTCDVNTLQRYAGNEFAEANRLAQDAAALNALTESGKIEEKYRAALSRVQAAYARAMDRKSEYDRLYKRFEELWADAKDCRLNVHAPDAWARIAPLEAMLDEDAKFDPVEATPRMEEGVAALEKLREFYDAIRKFDKTYVAYEEVRKGVEDDAWKNNLPEKWEEIEATEKQARDLLAQHKWAEAGELFGTIQTMLASGYGDVEQVRKDAEAAEAALMQTMEGIRREEIQQFSPAVWEKVAAGLQKVDVDMAEFRYRAVVDGAKEITTLVTETVAAIADALAKRDRTLAELEKLYKEASANRRFYRKNWPEDWKSVEDLYRESRLLAGKRGEHVALVQVAGRGTELLQRLITDGASVQRNADQAKQNVALILKKVNQRLFEDNVPEQWGKAREAISLGDRNYRLENMNQATLAFLDARKILEVAAKEVSDLRKTTEDLRAEAARRKDEYFVAFSVFSPEQAREVVVFLRTGDAHFGRSNWRLAKPEYTKALELLPAGRFVGKDGVVTDYIEGLMWVGDDTGPGGNDGETMDWYEALAWVDSLEYAGFKDWRLPTDEELHVLSAVPKKEYDALFKKAFEQSYWTRTDLIDDVAKAFYYDFSRARSGLGNKRTELHVRPVRSPRR